MAQEVVNGHGRDCSEMQDEINKSIDALDAELREINLKVFSPTNVVSCSNLTSSRSIKTQSWDMRNSKLTIISALSFKLKAST